MRLGQQSFFQLHTDVRTLKRHIEIAPGFASALTSWGAGTRVSPVWGVHEFGTSEAVARKFANSSSLFFIGPVAPARLTADLARANEAGAMQVWLTLGCFNLIVCIDNATRSDLADEVAQWAKRERIQP